MEECDKLINWTDSNDCNDCKGFGTSPIIKNGAATNKVNHRVPFWVASASKKDFTLLDSLKILNITYLPRGSVGLTVSLASVCPAPDKEHFSEAERDFFPLFQCAAPAAIFSRVCLCLYFFVSFVFLCLTLSLLKFCAPDQLFLANWPLVVVVQLNCSQNCSINQLLYACILYYVFSFKHN